MLNKNIETTISVILIVLTTMLRMFALILIFIMLVSTCHAKPCLSKAAAEAKWGGHLYWHTERHCWDNVRGGHGSYDEPEPAPRAKKLVDIPSPPKPVATITVKTPTIMFPDVVYNQTDLLDQIPLLVRQPWLSPQLMHEWPLLIDIDRPTFKTWNKRIGIEP